MVSFPVRGIVEGFYGRPWSHAERLKIFDFMHAYGMNAYLYAPKADPYHRVEWKVAYPETDMRAFAELVRRADELGIVFTFALSPGLSLRYSDPDELDALIAKYWRFYELGVRSFALLFDDIPVELAHEADRAAYGRLAAAQADFVTRLYRRFEAADPTLRLVVCPTIYCGSPDQDYLVELGATLPGPVDLLWTGPDVCSRELTHAHLSAVGSVMRRPPLIWDNYPVNDLGMVPELHIGPYTGRDPALPAVARGILANPMNQAEASMLPLATVAAYLNDPEGYHPERAWRAAAVRLVGEAQAEAFAIFAESNTISCLSPGDPPALRALFERFAADRDAARYDVAVDGLAVAVQRMSAAAATLQKAMNGDPLLQDMRPWVEEYGHWVTLLSEALAIHRALLALERVGESADGASQGQALSAARAALQLRLEAAQFKTRVGGDAIRRFLDETLRASGPIEATAAA